jgi:hypothetical protein
VDFDPRGLRRVPLSHHNRAHATASGLLFIWKIRGLFQHVVSYVTPPGTNRVRFTSLTLFVQKLQRATLFIDLECHHPTVRRAPETLFCPSLRLVIQRTPCYQRTPFPHLSNAATASVRMAPLRRQGSVHECNRESGSERAVMKITSRTARRAGKSEFWVLGTAIITTQSYFQN